MSASVEQRSNGHVSNGPSKEPEVNYVPTQQNVVEYSTAPSAVDMYGMMSNYYPYYTMPEDMSTLASAWSNGDAAAAAAAYGYGSEYAAMMPDYGYGYGWYPGMDGNIWGGATTVPATVNDDLGNSYAAANGFYTVEAVPMYDNTGAVVATDGMLSSVENGMQNMNITNATNTSNSDSTEAVKPTVNNGTANGVKSWAAVAGQPATFKPRHGAPGYFPVQYGKTFNSAGNGWESREYSRQAHESWSSSRHRPSARSTTMQSTTSSSNVPSPADSNGTVAMSDGQYNPKEFDLSPKGARFFIIKSYAEDDIHRSIKYGIWCSTDYGNKRLDAAYREREGKGPIYLFYSVNGSGHFCGIAQMTSAVDYQSSANVWTESKWKGQFTVDWIYVKDVPNSQLRHIRLENNEGKPVTNSRDTQEVPSEKGCQVLRIIHQYRHTTSIFDDFSHYEKLQVESAPTQN